MFDYEKKAYPVFDMFREQWGLVTAGSIDRFNACTVSWGSLGTLWTKSGKNGSVVTVYLYPARYTQQVMTESDTFTVSFFPESCKRALEIMGSRSGRDGDKTKAAGLTPIPMGGGVAYEEADLTFLCKKLYQHQFSKDDIAEDVQAYYQANPKAYPVDENGEWQPHWMFVGEIIEVKP